MRVMVTGAAGLLGHNVARQLLERGDEVVAVDALNRFRLFGDEKTRQPVPDILRHERCLFVEADFADDDVFNLMEVDAIVHAAAQTSHPRSIAIPAEDFRINALGTLRLLETLRAWGFVSETMLRRKKAPRLVFIGSAKVYGEHVCDFARMRTTGAYRHDRDPSAVKPDTRIEPATPEEDVYGYWESGVGHGVTEDCPIGDGGIMTPFGVSKAAADLMCQNFSKLYNLDIVILRPGCFTGPSSLAVEEQNWLPRLVRAAVRGETFPCYGFGGKQVRSLLHVDDLARAVLACLDAQGADVSPPGKWLAAVSSDGVRHDEPYWRWNGDVFNVDGGPENSLSILEAVDVIEEITGKRCELRHEAGRPGDWPWYCGSYRRIENVLGWKPTISVGQIVQELCDEAVR